MEFDTFEKAFADFIDRTEYDEAQNALFNIVRLSFKAGWQAAGGNLPKPRPVIRIVPKKPEK